MSDKMSIEWHEKDLENSKQYETRLREQLSKYIKEKRKEINRLKRNNKFYTYQISEAKRLNKGGFDSDKFRVKKGK